MAVSPFTYDLYLQMRSERHMDLISSLALLSPYRDGWKDCWPCGLAFKAVLRSRHLSSLPCVDVTVLSALEVLHYNPCLRLALVLQQQSIQLPFRTMSRMFSTTGKFSLCFLSQASFSWEWFDLHIHWAYASDAHLVRPGNGVISGQLQGKSATRLNDMQI